MRPSGRHAAFALAIALSWTPACADSTRVTIPETPGRFAMTFDHQERRMKAEAAFQSVLCGPPAIRRRACRLPPDDERLYRRAFMAWFKAMWPLKPTLWGARAG